MLSVQQKLSSILVAITLLAWLWEGTAWNAEDVESLVLKGAFRRAIQTYGDSNTLTANEYYFLAVCYLEIGDLKSAETILQKLLSSSEKERCLLALAHLKNAEGSFSESEQFFRQFISEFPKSQQQPAGLFGLSEVLFQKKNTPEGVEILLRLRRNYPLSSEAEKSLEILNRELGPFALQVGAFSEMARAEKVRDDLSAKGYNAYIVRSVDTSLIYRVRFGNFKERIKAESAGQALKAATGLDFRVVR
ncbi:MAG: SPOR domain-containing protein [Candidatus Omnitrophota bacterium]